MISGTREVESPILLLGKPWASDDALALCAGLTGIGAQVCFGEGLPPQSEACRSLEAMGPGEIWRKRGTLHHYRCSLDSPCVVIPLVHSQPRGHAFIWLRACATSDSARDVCPRKGQKWPGGPAHLSDDGSDADNFDLAVNLLVVMADHVCQTGAQRAAARAAPSPLTALQRRLVRGLCRSVHERGCETNLRLGAFAAENSVSVAYLCTLFARGVGVPFRAYLQAWRLHKVKVWLREGRLSIKEIAGRTGYSSANRLRLALKAATGLSPRAWRERHSGVG